MTNQSFDQKAIKDTFSPEFLNRFDKVIPFNPLPPKVVENIAEKFIAELEMQLLEKQVDLEVKPEAVKWLADEILFGKLEHGGTVSVGLIEKVNSETQEKEKELSFEYESRPAPTPKSKKTPSTNGKDKAEETAG